VGDERTERARDGVWGSLRRHPVIVSTIVVGTLLGAVLGALFLTGDWSLARRVVAGAVSGAGIAFLMTATKMFSS
jgi:hypothetical protein